jgi:hypothetical protein
MVSPHPDYDGTRFVIDGGDGDQWLFGSYMLLERVVAPWFQSGPNSWLMRVIGGTHTGLVLALSPRTLGSIDQAIATDGSKSVVVRGIEQHAEREDRVYPAGAIGGMTFLDVLK